MNKEIKEKCDKCGKYLKYYTWFGWKWGNQYQSKSYLRQKANCCGVYFRDYLIKTSK